MVFSSFIKENERRDGKKIPSFINLWIDTNPSLACQQSQECPSLPKKDDHHKYDAIALPVFGAAQAWKWAWGDVSS